MSAEIQQLRLENARLRIRAGDLEDACRAARRALRKVMQIAGRSLHVEAVDRDRGIVTFARAEDERMFERVNMSVLLLKQSFDANGGEVA